MSRFQLAFPFHYYYNIALDVVTLVYNRHVSVKAGYVLALFPKPSLSTGMSNKSRNMIDFDI